MVFFSYTVSHNVPMRPSSPMKPPARLVSGNLAWGRDGEVWALFRVASPEASPDAVARAIALLPSEAAVLSLALEAPERRACFLAACLPRGRSVARAAGGEVSRAFGLPPLPPPGAGAQRRVAGQLLDDLADLLPVRAAAPEEVVWIHDRLRPAPRAVAQTARGRDLAPGLLGVAAEDSPGRGWLRLGDGAGSAYLALLRAAALPPPAGRGRWTLGPAGLDFPLDWCARLRPLQGRDLEAAPGGVAVSLVYAAHAGDLLELGERVVGLTGALGAAGCRLERPASEQRPLLEAMLPAAPDLPALRCRVHVISPAGLAAALPLAGAAVPAGGPPGPPARPRLTVLTSGPTATEPAGAPTEAGATHVLRVTAGPRRGAQVPLGAWTALGRGGADLDLADPSIPSRAAGVEARDGTFSVRGPNGAEAARLAPGETFAVGGSEILLLEVAPRRPSREGSSPLGLRLVTPGRPARQVALDRPLVLGSGPDADLAVQDPEVAPRHCEIGEARGAAILRDLGAPGGTLVNGRPVASARLLHPGDALTLGATTVTVTAAPAGRPRASGREEVELAVAAEGDEPWAAVVACPEDATCGEVAPALAVYLGLAPAGEWCLYRQAGGLLLPPSLPWSEADVLRGDVLVVGPLAEGAASPAPLPGAEPGCARGGETSFPRRLAVSRPPRTVRPPAPVRVALPPVPEDASLRGRGIHWQLLAGLGFGATAVVGGIMLPGHRWLAFLFGFVSLFAVLAGFLADRSRRRSDARRFLLRLEELEGELASEVARRRETLLAACPGGATAAGWAGSRNDRLWERRPADADFLALRTGRGPRPTLLDADRGDPGARGPLAERLSSLLRRHGTLDAAPVLLPGPAAPVVGVAGPPEAADALARSLLLQAAALHAPRDLHIAVVAGSHRWAWARWLPHAAAGTAAPRVATDPEAADALAGSLVRGLSRDDRRPGEPAPGPALLVVADQATASRPSVAALLDSDLAGRAVVIVLADTRRALPSRIATVLEQGRDGWTMVGAGAESGPLPLEPEALGLDEAAAAARAMAPLYEAGAPEAGARGAGLLDLLGISDPAAAPVEELWSAAGVRETLAVPVGVTDAGEVLTLGFRRDGPHGLVAGTTSSGKSELLQTILSAIGLTHPPELVNFVLVDYKGGAAFSDIARLPHTVGLVTDLDGALAARALISLNSELRRRERILREADVPNVVEYERQGFARARPLANLLIVVDEFATLAQELPGFIDALVDVAQRGRSLGVHLLLATQSPGGVVSPKIQANTNMWICLRVTLESESVTVIGTKDAALIPVNAPGRGYLKMGSALTPFQSARIARSLGEAVAGASGVGVEPFVDLRPTPAPPASPLRERGHDRAATELQVVTARIAAEAARLGVRPQERPWLPPLPARLVRGDVPDVGEPDRSRLTALVGLCDEPELQSQTPFRLDLSADGGCAVLGAFGSGKTTLLRQVALDLALGYQADAVHLYGLDAGDGSLAALEALPHCADVVSVDDLDRTLRLIRRLERLAEARRAVLAEAGAGDWVRCRRAQPEAGPWIVLLLDDYAAFVEATQGYRHGALAESLQALLRTGPQVGIHTLLAAQQRTDLTTTMLGLFGRRILLRQAERSDYDLVDLRRDHHPAAPPTGRGFAGGDIARELQVIWPAGAGDAYPPLDVAAELASRTRHLPEGSCPRPVPGFPAEVHLARLAGEAPRPAGHLVLGVGGEELGTVAIDLGRVGPHLLVAGRDRSGRSTALLTCMESLAGAESRTAFVVVAPRPSPMRDLAGRPGILRVAAAAAEIGEALEEAEAAAASRPVVLLIDDCECLPPQWGPRLDALLRRARETGLRAIVAGRTSDLARLYDDWARYLRSLQCGLLLTPDPADGDLLEVRLPAERLPRLPGRGWLVLGASTVKVQVALPGRPWGTGQAASGTDEPSATRAGSRGRGAGWAQPPRA